MLDSGKIEASIACHGEQMKSDLGRQMSHVFLIGGSRFYLDIEHGMKAGIKVSRGMEATSKSKGRSEQDIIRVKVL